MSKKKDLRGVPHEKTSLSRGIVLEQRNTIGFARIPVSDTRFLIDGLPVRHDTRID